MRHVVQRLKILTTESILAQDQVSMAPLFGRFAIRAYLLARTATVALGAQDEDPSLVSYTLPSACGDWVVSQKYDHSTNQSIVWLYNIATGTKEELIGSSGERNYVLPKV